MLLNISTPAIWYPGQSDVELNEEIFAMLVRSQMTSDFIEGKFEADIFLDFLDSQGLDVFGIAQDWVLDDGIIS
jgi:hypothetical protein